MFRTCLTVAFLILICGLTEAQAQRTPNFNRRPAFSPLINLFNNNQGGINNYFQFVRPQLEQARFNQRQQAQNQLLQQQLMNPALGGGGLQPGFIQPGMAGGGLLRPAGGGLIQPTTHATYFNYSHFYGRPVNMNQNIGPITNLRRTR